MRTLAALLAITFMAGLALAQETGEAGERSLGNFRVLQGWKFDLGDRAIFLNRVAPPILPPTPPPPPTAPPPAEEVAHARIPQKKHEVLFLSATVYDHCITEVRSFGGEHKYRFLTNIDFNLLAGLGSLETADTSYLLILGIENESREAVEAFNQQATQNGEKDALKQIPSVESFSKTRSEYVVAPDEPDVQPPAEILAALDALLAYHDANRARLAEEYARRETARAAQERQAEKHPPTPKDTVIHYWRKSSVPAPAETKEGR